MRNSIIFSILSFLFVFSFASDLMGYESPKEINKINGYWMYDCSGESDYSGYVDFSNDDEVIINIADNQIYIMARAIYSKNVFEMYYKSSDIGRGGMDIEWDKVSKEYPIATFKMLTDNKMSFSWIGLKDARSKRIGLPFFSLPVERKDLTLIKCVE